MKIEMTQSEYLEFQEFKRKKSWWKKIIWYISSQHNPYILTQYFWAIRRNDIWKKYYITTWFDWFQTIKVENDEQFKKRILNN